MNDLLKTLSKALQPLGYHIRPRQGLNFLKISALENKDNSVNITTLRKSLDHPVPKAPDGNLDFLHIYLRTCLRANRNSNPRPLLTGPDGFENAYRCLWSLVQAINFAHEQNPDLKIRLTIMDDRSTQEAILNLEKIMAHAKIETAFQTTAITGQGESLHETFLSGAKQDGIVYFVEDDYLHEKDAIVCLHEFYKFMALTSGSHLVLYPQEHHELYANHYPSYIVLGQDRHWRSIRHATHTFVTHGKVVEKFWPFFENTKFVGVRKKRKLGSENRTTNKLFLKIPGFSPLRPWAVHLQYEDLLPPFFDWHPLWDQNKLPE